MQNEGNLKPDERVDEIMEIANTLGANSVISYFLDQMTIHSTFKRFDDECYWKDVKQEFKLRMKYDI
jgi:hypothetical protein